MSKEWRSLDNAAKIFPSANKGSDTQVFRFSCELSDKIERSILQSAMDATIEIFDIYRFTMKRGLFWYYLEKTNISPIVRPEYKTPCSSIFFKEKSGLLFEVTYFKNRINLEVYHVLSDGTGAMNFLKALVTKYICLRYNLEDIQSDYDASRTQMKDDSFAKYYSTNGKGKQKRFKTAYRLKGTKVVEDRLNIITGQISVSDTLAIARKFHTTITAFLCACLVEAIGKDMSNRAKNKDIVLSIPVNLRKYFPSQSARNFFSLVYVKYNFIKEEGSFESIIKKIDSDLKKNLSAEKLSETINTFSALENNFFVKIIPLSIKDIFLRFAYRISKLESTVAVSNIGIVKMPVELEKYIRSFDVYAGTDSMQVCLCSYSDILSINFTSPMINTDIQRLFFRKLSTLGLDVELFSNITGEDL